VLRRRRVTLSDNPEERNVPSISLERYQPYLLGLLRIVTAFLFLQHGTAKFFGFPHVAMFDGLKFFSMLGAAGALEIGGGLLLLVGFLRGRPPSCCPHDGRRLFHGAFSQRAAADLNQGEPAVLFCFIFLYLAAAGPGASR